MILSEQNPINIHELKSLILQGDSKSLSKAITLIESNSSKHIETAQELLNSILTYTEKSLRIGITGIPGAGKSTFIESYGLELIKRGHKVAVLAIDPSSSLTKGSILGDKTRMEKLSRSENCFIRPSPARGSLGGVANKTRETILLCEAAGYDRILVESVGVGQSEIELRSMVDYLMLLLIPGGGDELQGIKKGIIEIADTIIINKADGQNVNEAKIAAAEYSSAMKYLNHYTAGWDVAVRTCSAIYGTGINELLDLTNEFEIITKESGVFDKTRNEQLKQWMDKLFLERIKLKFLSTPEIISYGNELKEKVLSKEITPSVAADKLIERILK